MNVFNGIKKICENPQMIFVYIDRLGIKRINDEKYLKILYRTFMKKELNLEDPKTYTEKLQWLKLFDRNPLYTKLVDKYEVKKYIADTIGNEYIIHTLGIYDKFDDINFDILPKQFVMKCTHDSGGVYICKDKEKINKKKIKKFFNRLLNKNFFYSTREWPYKNVKPRIIIEEYIENNSSKDLKDYKFFCFNGKMYMMFVATDRQNENCDTCFDFFDRDYNHLNIKNGHPNAKKIPEKPIQYEKMIELAEKIAKNFNHIRVDFYEANGKIYFGELTFFHWSGLVPFEPEEWDKKLGDLIKINKGAKK